MFMLNKISESESMSGARHGSMATGLVTNLSFSIAPHTSKYKRHGKKMFIE